MLPIRCSRMALKYSKITLKWPKRPKGCALSKPRQYFCWEARKKTAHFFTFVYQTIDCLGQFDMPGCQCLCSVVSIALGTKSFGAGVRARFWEKLFFPVFSLSYLTTPPPFDFVCTIGIFEKKNHLEDKKFVGQPLRESH